MTKIVQDLSLKKTFHKKDFYFLSPGINDIISLKGYLRLRIEGENYFLGYKQKKLIQQHEENEEIEYQLTLPFNSLKWKKFFQNFKEIQYNVYSKGFLKEKWIKQWIESQGFKFYLKKEKKGNLYQILKEGFPVQIELHKVLGLGCFLEIEILLENRSGITKAHKIINQLFDQFKINLSQIESRAYIQILKEKSKIK